MYFPYTAVINIETFPIKGFDRYTFSRLLELDLLASTLFYCREQYMETYLESFHPLL